jgi:hypothetical protein
VVSCDCEISINKKKFEREVIMLEQTLRKEIPNKLSSFRKLTEGHDPYYFASWEKENGASILRYWFWNKSRTKQNKKRVFINEIEKLLKYSIQEHRITRKDYKQYCPRTMRDGPCGFAVIIGILEHFQVVEIVEGEYIVKNVEKLMELLG